MFDKLKLALEGKTILAVEPGNAPESICCFKLSDGKSWRLFATDLGYWIEETAGFEGYTKLDNLIRDYYYHVYWLAPKYEYDLPNAQVEIFEEQINITAPEGKIFTIDKSKCSDNEMKILNHPVGLEIFKKAIGIGDMWALDFRNNDDCPEELKGLV